MYAGKILIMNIIQFVVSHSWILHGLGWLLSSIVGSFVTYCFIRRRDNEISEENKTDNLVSMCNLVCLNLAFQYSELENLKMNIHNRLPILSKITDVESTYTRDEIVQLMQDFHFCKDINIDINNTGKLLLSAAANKRGATEILQSVFLSNKNYFNVINVLERYHESKRLICTQSQSDDVCLVNLARFLQSNAPQYLEQINKAQSFGKQTFDFFKKTMLEMFEIKIYMSLGERIKLD